MHISRRLALAASLLLLAGGLHAQQVMPAAQQAAVQRAEALTQAQIEGSSDSLTLGRLAALYKNVGDTERYRWTMTRLTTLLPGNLKLKLDLAASYAADDMKTPAYDVLLKMKGQGFGVDLSKDARFEKIHGTEVWGYIVDSLKANMQPFGKGRVAYRLPPADLLVDALAWDAGRKQLLAGSARTGGVYRVDSAGKLHDFIKADASNQLWSVFALAADAKHNRLWVATTSVVYFQGFAPDNAGKAALVEFELSSGKLIKRYPLDVLGTAFLSSLALAPDGTVYAADGVNKVVYKLAKGGLVQVLANSHLNDIRALTLSGDGKILYMVDTQLGILGYDLAAGKGFGLRYPLAGLVLPGVVDLHWYDGTLVLIEPGMQPSRVMRLSLSKDGRSVTKAMPLDVAKPEFSWLGTGTVAGDTLYFIANSQRGKYDRRGELKDGETLSPLVIWRSDLRFEWDQGGVNLGLQEIPTAKNAKQSKVTPPAHP